MTEFVKPAAAALGMLVLTSLNAQAALQLGSSFGVGPVCGTSGSSFVTTGAGTATGTAFERDISHPSDPVLATNSFANPSPDSLFNIISDALATNPALSPITISIDSSLTSGGVTKYNITAIDLGDNPQLCAAKPGQPKHLFKIRHVTSPKQNPKSKTQQYTIAIAPAPAPGANPAYTVYEVNVTINGSPLQCPHGNPALSENDVTSRIFKAITQKQCP